jgi:glycosyltransferase involved in cell wall biosynthesis
VDDLDELYRENGAAAVTLRSGPRNHELALPNKLFHAVRAGVPVVAADLPELRRVVTEHDLGELYTPGDAGSIAAATARLSDRYPELVAGVAAARPALSWEHDARVLVDVYADVEQRRGA